MFDEKMIIVDLIPKGNDNRPGYPMKPEYITVHDTGNTNIGADALLHGKYVKNPSTSDSWHFTVDDKQIVQHLPLNENGWHAGDGRKGTGNRKSIGIEICMNKGIDRAKAEELAAKLSAYLMKKCGIPITKVVQHNHWSGKNCPQIIRSRANGWEKFTKSIETYANLSQVPKWQEDAFRELVRKGIIGTPSYWENRLHKNITIGEMMAVMNKIS